MKIRRCAAVVKAAGGCSTPWWSSEMAKSAGATGRPTRCRRRVEKAVKDGSRSIVACAIAGTDSVEVEAVQGGGPRRARPAGPGTRHHRQRGGRARLRSVRIRDILTKSFGTSSRSAPGKATIDISNCELRATWSGTGKFPCHESGNVSVFTSSRTQARRPRLDRGHGKQAQEATGAGPAGRISMPGGEGGEYLVAASPNAGFNSK